MTVLKSNISYNYLIFFISCELKKETYYALDYTFKFGLTFLKKNLITLSLILDFVLMLDYFAIIVIGLE